ncbi:putative bifunctional diguanylate cyclase/phosphodiesterase [Pseudomonas viridiflava]|uniref:putative bifunctional diguanylate cyclase/phosphodiesterase n=1 Tax=Pseudomonas viridiflava TaxID=33069 RepID=UPI000F051477|nr:EAL domain-containing protein [Pseudomonas viridiflava]
MFSEILSKLPSAVFYIASGQDKISYANIAAMEFFAPVPLQNARFKDLLLNEEQHERFDKLSCNNSSEQCVELLFKTTISADTDTELGEKAPLSFRAYVRRDRVAGGLVYYIRGHSGDVSSEGLKLALYDPLTKLPNRELLRDRMLQAIHAVARLDKAHLKAHIGVLFIDLDKFKKINDTCGHAAGDAVLVEIAHRLSGCVRESDTVARFGGDEFVVLLSHLRDTAETAVVAERILDACARPIPVGDNVFQISASVGVAAWPTDGMTADELLKNADMAMYSSKDGGRGRLRFYDPEMNEKAEARARTEAELKEALNDGNFVLHYQPQFCARSNRIVAVEALIRWSHPTRGLVQPAAFIQVAEDSNLITPIGDWVLREAVEQGRRWMDMGLDLRVAVNLSGRQFVDTLPGRVSEVLEQFAFPAQLLELELTESFLVADTEKAARILHALRDLGVRVALDDFGTGWSSLHYLQHFPVDTLKIDRSFIGSTAIEFDGRIVRVILGIAREFELSTLAEGVETLEQMDSLHELGCDAWQGFLLSKPISADELTKLCLSTDMAADRFSDVNSAVALQGDC